MSGSSYFFLANLTYFLQLLIIPESMTWFWWPSNSLYLSQLQTFNREFLQERAWSGIWRIVEAKFHMRWVLSRDNV